MLNRGVGLVIGVGADNSDLKKGLRDSEGMVKGWGTKIAAGLAVLGGLKIAGDFAGEALAEADRLGDAAARLELKLGKLAEPLKDVADDFSNLGLSQQDFLEMAAAFAEVETSLGVSAPLITEFADDAVRTAGALSLIKDVSPEEAIDLIGKAAGGSAKAMKALGISVTDEEVAAQAMKDTGKDNAKALTDQELAAARMKVVLDKLAPTLDKVESGEADVESATKTLGAKWETLLGKIGGGLEGPLTAVLTWINDMVDAIPGAIWGWQQLGRKVGDALAPLARMVDMLAEAVDWLREMSIIQERVNLGGNLTGGPGGFSAFAETGGISGAGFVSAPFTINIYGDPQTIEAMVVKSLNDYTRRNGFAPLQVSER